MYTVGMNRGEFGLVLYGTYTDINKGQSNYYSEFNPDHAILYSGKNQRIFKYTNIDKQWLSNTFKSWYNWVDKQYKEAA